jgi:hypothetical protein
MINSLQPPNSEGLKIAYFISSHGFGHAARASGVMAAIHEIDPLVRFEIFTESPYWFFKNSISGPFSYHFHLTDIGMVQKTPLHEDFTGTLQLLKGFLPFDDYEISDLAGMVRRLGCRLVICDIAPMGITVAQEAGVPSVLVENFTWDWVYAGYSSYGYDIDSHIKYLKNIFQAVDYHIQVEPVCSHLDAHFTASPVSRKTRMSPKDIRAALGVPISGKIVMVTMGGVPERFGFLDKLAVESGVYFVIPGAGDSLKASDNVILLPQDSEFFHPDLINASDAVIGKVGYSTLAEVYHAGVPFGYITRPKFLESEILARFIMNEMKGFSIDEREFQEGKWVTAVPELLALPRIHRNGPNGAEQVAGFVLSILE